MENQWPIDFEKLNKGDVISESLITEAYGRRPTDREYPFVMLRLREQIERTMEELGSPVTVKQEGTSLRILTDEEAVAYNDERFSAHARGLKRSYARQLIVDTNQLRPETVQRHTHQLAVNGRKLLAIEEVARVVRIEQAKALVSAEERKGEEAK